VRRIKIDANACQPCGHARRFIVSDPGGEGTNHCSECERIARLEARVKELELECMASDDSVRDIAQGGRTDRAIS